MSDVVSQERSGLAGNDLINGALAGLVGGLVFGAMMAFMGMLPMVGMLVGQESAVIGFVVHMVISAIIGAGYGLVAPRLPAGAGTAVVFGAVYGVIWWVLGALVMMPLMLGMSEMVFVIQQAQVMSLIGHILFGVITGLAFMLLRQR